MLRLIRSVSRQVVQVGALARPWAACAGFFAAPLLALAGPLDHERVDKDTLWVVHLDVEAGMNSKVGRYLAEKAPPIVAVARIFQDRCGFDPRTSLQGVTLYGFAGEDDGVGVVAASAALDRFIERLPSTYDKYERSESAGEGGSTLHSWVQDGRKWFCCVRESAGGERIALFACTQTSIDRALRVMDGRASSLKGSGCALGGTPREGSIFFAAAKNMDRSVGRHGKSSLMRNAKSMRMDIGEYTVRAAEGAKAGEGEREFYAEVRIVTASEQAANEMRGLASGSLAVVRMAISGQPDAAQLSEMLRGIVFEAKGSELVMHARQSAEKMVEALSKVTFPEIPTSPKAADDSQSASPDDGNGGPGKPRMIPGPVEGSGGQPAAPPRKEGGK